MIVPLPTAQSVEANGLDGASRSSGAPSEHARPGGFAAELERARDGEDAALHDGEHHEEDGQEPVAPAAPQETAPTEQDRGAREGREGRRVSETAALTPPNSDQVISASDGLPGPFHSTAEPTADAPPPPAAPGAGAQSAKSPGGGPSPEPAVHPALEPATPTAATPLFAGAASGDAAASIAPDALPAALAVELATAPGAEPAVAPAETPLLRPQPRPTASHPAAPAAAGGGAAVDADGGSGRLGAVEGAQGAAALGDAPLPSPAEVPTPRGEAHAPPAPVATSTADTAAASPSAARPEAGVPARELPQPARPFDAAGVLHQFRVHLSGGARETTLHLVPAQLGRIAIRLRMLDGRLDALVRVESPETLQGLERHLPELRATLAQEGIEAESLELELGFEEPAEQRHDGTARRKPQRSQRAAVVVPGATEEPGASTAHTITDHTIDTLA